MKNFDDFVSLINHSQEFQDSIASVPLNVEKRTYDLTNPEDLGILIHAVDEMTLNRFMKIFRKYHEWTNQN